MNKNNNISKSNSSSDGNRDGSNNNNDHDSSTKGTSKKDRVAFNTGKKKAGSDSTVSSINPSISTNNNCFSSKA